MTNHNIIQHGTQTTGLGIMIAGALLIVNMGINPASCNCWLFFFQVHDSSFRYANDEQKASHTRDHSVENGVGKITN